jgi:hypothetical protein
MIPPGPATTVSALTSNSTTPPPPGIAIRVCGRDADGSDPSEALLRAPHQWPPPMSSTEVGDHRLLESQGCDAAMQERPLGGLRPGVRTANRGAP